MCKELTEHLGFLPSLLACSTQCLLKDKMCSFEAYASSIKTKPYSQQLFRMLTENIMLGCSILAFVII